MLINLEKVGEWTDKESVYYVKKESDVNTRKAVSKIYRILNQKKEEHMGYVHINARKLDSEIRKIIKEIVESCEICEKDAK